LSVHVLIKTDYEMTYNRRQNERQSIAGMLNATHSPHNGFILE